MIQESSFHIAVMHTYQSPSKAHISNHHPIIQISNNLLINIVH